MLLSGVVLKSGIECCGVERHSGATPAIKPTVQTVGETLVKAKTCRNNISTREQQERSTKQNSEKALMGRTCSFLPHMHLKYLDTI